MVNKKAPNPVDVHVGSRIRLRRTLVGMSQEKLGDGLGITFQQVQKYEKGTNRVGASRLQAISGILGVQPRFFFEGGPQQMSGEESAAMGEIGGLNGFIASKEGLELNRSFAKIRDPAIRKKIVSLVLALSKTPDSEVSEEA